MRILVYTPGKCGSTAITFALREAGFDVLNTHRFEATGEKIEDFQKIITVFREPIGQTFSWFFENHWKEGMSAEEMVERFWELDRSTMCRAVRWFTHEFLEHTGIDIYKEYPIDPWDADLLLLKYQQRHLWPEELRIFVGTPVVLKGWNESRKKKYGSVYEKFLDLVRPLPWGFGEMMLQDLCTTTFMDGGEILCAWTYWDKRNSS